MKNLENKSLEKLENYLKKKLKNALKARLASWSRSWSGGTRVLAFLLEPEFGDLAPAPGK